MTERHSAAKPPKKQNLDISISMLAISSTERKPSQDLTWTMQSPSHTFKKVEFKTHQTTEQSG